VLQEITCFPSSRAISEEELYQPKADFPDRVVLVDNLDTRRRDPWIICWDCLPSGSDFHVRWVRWEQEHEEEATEA